MTALRVAAVGLGPWEQDSLRATIALASGTELAQWLLVPDPAQADVVLAGDGGREGRAWLQRVADGQGPLVVACVERGAPAGPAGSFMLRQPIAYVELVALLRALEPLLRERARAQRVPTLHAAPPAATVVATAAPDPVPAAAPAVVVAPVDDEAAVAGPVEVEPVIAGPAKAGPVVVEPATVPHALADRAPPGHARRGGRFFDGTRLLGLVRCVLASGVDTELRHPKFPLLTVYPGSRTYTLEVDAAELPGMFRSSSLEFDVRRRPHAAYRAGHPQVHQPVTRLLYYAARFGAEGRLAEGTDVDDSYELAASADLAVVDVDARDRAILECLGRGPATLHAIVAATGLDFDSVVDFTGGCAAVGFVHRRSHAGVARATPPSFAADEPANAGLTATVAQLRERVKSALPFHGG